MLQIFEMVTFLEKKTKIEGLNIKFSLLGPIFQELDCTKDARVCHNPAVVDWFISVSTFSFSRWLFTVNAGSNHI